MDESGGPVVPPAAAAGPGFAARAARAGLLLAFAALLAAPHLPRLRYPSVYGDDVMRIGMLQTQPLFDILFRPFNEHMAPVFDAVTWVAWQAAGARLERTPVAFTLGALVPFGLTLAALAWLVRREVGAAAALLAVALFNFAPVHVIETVWWFSGSNHMWALLFALLALVGAGLPGPRGWALEFLGALLAPWCSAMGWLAGPVAAVRGLCAPPGESTPARGRLGRAVAVVAPLAGVMVNFGVSLRFGFLGQVRIGVRENTDLAAGLRLVARAPAATLVPDFLGLKDVDTVLPEPFDAALTGGLVVALLVWAGLDRKRRGAVLAGLGLLLGGYLITYPFRSIEGPYWTLRVARYHLFPALGLAWLVALAAGKLLRPLDSRPLARAGFAAAAAAGLLALHAGRFLEQGDLYHFPDQPRVLAVLEKVAAVGRDRGMTRDQLLKRLDPVNTRWDPLEWFPVQMMMPAASASARVPDDAVKAAVLAALTPREREALCGGMDAGPYLGPVAGLPAALAATLAEGVPAGTLRVREGRGPGRYRTEGWPSHLEYQLAAAGADLPADARSLAVPASDPNLGVEVWWSPGGDDWSPTRSVRWRPRGPGDWAVPLAALPHWDPSQARRLRYVFRYAGPVTAEPPRLLGPPPAGPRAAGG